MKLKAITAAIAIAAMIWVGVIVNFIVDHERLPLGAGEVVNWLFGLG